MDPYRSAKPDVAAQQGPAAPTSALKRSFNPWLRIGVACAVFAAAIAVLYAISQDSRVPMQAGVAVGAVVLFIAFYVALILFYRKRALALVRANNDGVALIAAGKLDEAIHFYSDLFQRAGRMHSLKAIFVTNLGIAYLRRCEPDRALEYLMLAERSGWLTKPAQRVNQGLMISCIAQAHFARGDVKEANEWLAKAQAVVVPARRAVLLPIESLLAARAADYARVDAMTSSGWAAAEGMLPAFQMRAVRLVRAFALARMGDGLPRDAEVAELLAGARPAKTGEFDYLTRQWPEFHSYLVEQRFSAA